MTRETEKEEGALQSCGIIRHEGCHEAACGDARGRAEVHTEFDLRLRYDAQIRPQINTTPPINETCGYGLIHRNAARLDAPRGPCSPARTGRAE